MSQPDYMDLPVFKPNQGKPCPGTSFDSKLELVVEQARDQTCLGNKRFFLVHNRCPGAAVTAETLE